MSNNQGKPVKTRLDNGYVAPKAMAQLSGNDNVTKGFIAPKPFDLTQVQSQGTATASTTTKSLKMPQLFSRSSRAKTARAFSGSMVTV